MERTPVIVKGLRVNFLRLADGRGWVLDKCCAASTPPKGKRASFTPESTQARRRRLSSRDSLSSRSSLASGRSSEGASSGHDNLGSDPSLTPASNSTTSRSTPSPSPLAVPFGTRLLREVSPEEFQEGGGPEGTFALGGGGGGACTSTPMPRGGSGVARGSGIPMMQRLTRDWWTPVQQCVMCAVGGGVCCKNGNSSSLCTLFFSSDNCSSLRSTLPFLERPSQNDKVLLRNSRHTQRSSEER